MSSVSASQAVQAAPKVVEDLLPSGPHKKKLRELHAALAECNPGLPLAERQATIVRVLAWIRQTSACPVPASQPSETPQHARLALVLDVLDQSSEWRDKLVATLTTVFAETSAIDLLTEVGIPSTRGLFDETMDRVSQWCLPRAREERELSETFFDAFPHRRDGEWLGALGPALLEAVTELLPPDAWRPLAASVSDAVRVLGMRAGSLGLARDMRLRAGIERLDDSPFYALPHLVDALVDGRATTVELLVIVERCKVELGLVRDHLEQAGVSVDLVYRMDLIGRILERIALLAPSLDVSQDEAARRARLPLLLSTLVAAEVSDRSLRETLQESTRLLARKVIERVGSTGEHYITASRKAWWAMLRSAGGGGILTAGTAAGKFFIVQAKLPMFIEGILSSVDYAGSFLVMQLLGFTLATKQPSMTAAALAAALRNSDAGRRVSEVVQMIARMCRSQLAAAMGNVGLVIPAAIGLDKLYQSRVGTHFLDAHTAEHVLEILDVTDWKTIWFAALTGVYLWISSLCAGWLENWAVYRRLPEAIEQHRIKNLIGARATRWLAAKFRTQVAGAGGSISLGTILGLAPVFGKGFGLPIGAAHVTLSAGSLVLAISSLGWQEMGTPAFAKAAGGIAVIGLLNFSVSFILALWVAMRARAVGNTEKIAVAKGLLGHVFRRPLDFMYPPKGETDAPHH